MEYARSLLLKLEHDSTSIKIQSQKQAIQTDLQVKRELIKRLNQRLTELDQLDDSEDDDSDDDEDEDVQTNHPSYAPAIRNASNGIDTVHDTPELQQAAANLTSTLRSRNAKPTDQPPQDKATTTGTSLFSSKTSKSAPSATSPSKDDLHSHHRAEHEAIADSLVAMAQALKANALKFGQTLEGEDKDILERARTGLDKNQLGLESASRGMGALKRMTEGTGWFGRLSLWAKLAVLWVVAILLVFAMPKLRF